MPHELTKNKKKLEFCSVIFFYSAQQQWTISWMNRDMWPKVDFMPQLATTSWTKKKIKHIPKPNMHQKVSWSLFGGLLPFDSIQLYESWQNYYIWEVCSANQWDAPKTATAAPGIGQQNGPNSFARQRPVNWDMNFCLTCHSHLITHQPTTTSSISTTFCRENTSITSKRQEMLS